MRIGQKLKAKAKSKNALLPGTLEMLILKMLSIESMHGYGIAQRIQMLSADVLTIEEGSLYPALRRMLVKRRVLAEWKISANNRRVPSFKSKAAHSNKSSCASRLRASRTWAVRQFPLIVTCQGAWRGR